MPRLLLLISCFLSPAFAQSDQAARLERAFAAIDKAFAASTNPGAVIAITDRNRTLKIGAYGYSDLNARTRITPDTLFEIGSVSKSFAAISLMQLFDEGRFDPQAPLTKYLPWFEIKSRFRPITGHDILTHTAGLQNYRPDLASMPFAAWSVRDFVPSYAPGEHFWYSNLGFQILGYVLERIEGARYESIVRRRVLDRVGMSATQGAIVDALRARLPVSYSRWPYNGEYAEEPWFEYLAADGSIASTAGDMAAYARLILNRGMAPAGRVLSDRAFAMLTKPALNQYAYGLFVRDVDGDTVISHGGGIAGFATLFEAHMNDGFGIVVMGNGGLDRPLVQWASAAVKTAIRNQPLPDPPARHDPSAVSNAADYAGVYSGSGKTLEFAADGNRLLLKREGRSIPLLPMQANTFRVESDELAEFPFLFQRASGKVVEVSHGPEWFTNSAYSGPKQFEAPAEYAAYTGRYVNHNPEEGAVRVYVLKGKLLMDGTALIATGPAAFRPAEPDFTPERVVFDTIVDGKALRMFQSGMPMYRMEAR